MLLLPSSLPCVSVVWGCLVYRFSLPTIPPPLPPHSPRWVMHCAVVRVSGMLCPPSSQVLQPPPPVCTGTWPVGWLAVGFRVAWLVVALCGWLLVDWFWHSCVWLVGEVVGWLVGWFVGWLVVGYLLACVCVYCPHTCCVVLLHTVPVCKPVCAAIARVFGGVVHISFWRSSGVLARFSSGVLGSEAAPLERR